MAFARRRSASAPAAVPPSAPAPRPYSSPNRKAGFTASVFVRAAERSVDGVVTERPLAHWYRAGDGGCFATGLYDVLQWMDTWRTQLAAHTLPTTSLLQWPAPRGWMALDPTQASPSRFVYDVLLVKDDATASTGVGLALRDRADFCEFLKRTWSTADVTRRWQAEMIQHHLLRVEQVDMLYSVTEYVPAPLPVTADAWYSAMARLWASS